MPFNFPSNPSLNQQSTQNGRVYRYAGNNVWELAVSASGLTWSSVPASATASGTAGQIAYDAGFFYVATATNTWKRAALSTWSNFTPASVTGLQLWLDASDDQTLYDATTGGSLVAADGAVARWEDKSGNGRHATQGTSANRPARKTAIQGGQDVLRFDGSNDSLAIAGTASAMKFLHSANSTVFFVLKNGQTSDPGTGDHFVLATYNTSTANVGIAFGTHDLSPTNDQFRLYINKGVSGSTVAYMGENGLLPSNVFAVASLVIKPTDATASNRVSYRRNGGAATTSNTETSAVSTADSQGDVTIGNVSNDYAFNFNGDIAEIIVYDSALSDTDREAVEDYLLDKWSIT